MKIEAKHHCRLCRGELELRLDLGNIALPRFERRGFDVAHAPLVLTECSTCGLAQLGWTVDQGELFQHSYYYESGLNEAMKGHLQGLVGHILNRGPSMTAGDTVIDIGCNDGTLLSAYGSCLRKVGYEPNGYEPNSYGNRVDVLIPEFFGAVKYTGPKAKVITSIAMLYDLDDPVAFAKEVQAYLADDGVWVTEQHYAPAMVENVELDVVCHEHLTYFRLRDIETIATMSGMRVYDVEFNDVNGGSFRCWIDKGVREQTKRLMAARTEEAAKYYDLKLFAQRATDLCTDLQSWLRRSTAKTIGLGASTKGSVLLQAAGIDQSLLGAVADRNPRKQGKVMPGTGIPIISEEEARAADPAVFLVLPYHFLDQLMVREHAFVSNGGRFLLPCPMLHLV